MTRTLAVALCPAVLAAALLLPAVASTDAASPPPASQSSALERSLSAALAAEVPGAAVNGLRLVSVESVPTGISDWHLVSGAAHVGTGEATTALRFRARYDAGSERVVRLALRWSAGAPTPLTGPTRKAIEVAAAKALRAEFPAQAPDVELLAVARHPTSGANAATMRGHRIYRGHGRIDFGTEGEVIAPIEVVFDDDARLVALRYSLDELDPAPFDTGPLSIDVRPVVASR